MAGFLEALPFWLLLVAVAALSFWVLRQSQTYDPYALRPRCGARKDNAVCTLEPHPHWTSHHDETLSNRYRSVTWR